MVDDIVGVGDANNRKEAERLAALSAYFELIKRSMVSHSSTSAPIRDPALFPSNPDRKKVSTNTH